MRRMRDELEAGDHSRQQLTSDLRLFCVGFCSTLTRHHTAEDTRLFPKLAGEHPDLASVVQRLMDDHTLIEQLLTGLADVLPRASSDELDRHLSGIEAIMESHFGFEERQLLPLLDEMDDARVDLVELLGVDPRSRG
jgi:hemerythrin-like domain-containing protein